MQHGPDGQTGRRADLDVTAMFRKVLAEPPGKKVKPKTKLEEVVRCCVDAARNGTLRPMERVLDQVGGRPGRATTRVTAARTVQPDPVTVLLQEKLADAMSK